jgi:SET domain-containing protein
MGSCNCGEGCQNQRFQRKQYAKVSVIRTEKKGYGLRADTDLQPNDFIYEYVGEVINEPTFRSRMLKYDREGIKHFYFMSLTKNEFVDATKKGNLGRFCNHSCNPNCYVDKWVVGEKLRMGIFAARHIQAGEELVFNYNVDRYGADPQPCYCGEPNCVGFIGGKTQTERATKLPLATIEALGIDDADGWETVAAGKKPRRKKANENDEDYVNSLQPRALDVDGVNKVMSTLMQCKEKWIAVKLLSRLQATQDEHLRHRVVRMHGYQILKSTLNTFREDNNVVLQVLDILYSLPRITKNKIADSKIEAVVEPLASSDHEGVASAAKRLLEEWSKLETAYRIPRKQHDHDAPSSVANMFEEERRKNREEPTKLADPLANVNIPTGPRSSIPQRNVNYYSAPRPRKLPTNLPAGWYVTTDKTGRYYFYDVNGKTQWQRPTAPAIQVPKASSKAQQDQKALQSIIDSLTKEPTPRHSAGPTPQRSSTPATEPKQEKWRSLPIEKQMKIYENTVSFACFLFPCIGSH